MSSPTFTATDGAKAGVPTFIAGSRPPIVEMKFGSHLFGTATPQSDLDYKAVHIPPAQDILLGRVKAVLTDNTKANTTVRNSAGDVDRESYTLQKFLNLAAEGQTVAMDMLFCTDELMVREPSPIWREIQRERGRLVTSRAASFVGYCRTQANKYGIKGSRMAAARATVELLSAALAKRGTVAPLTVIADELSAFVSGREHCSLVEIEQHINVASGNAARERRLIWHLEVCNRKCPLTFSIKKAHEIYKGLFDEYGKRALAAELNSGVDWKALSHAVRVARECVELLTTGNITFPRPEREHLIAIKTGRLPYKEVAEEIEMLLPAAEEASANSCLRAEPDRAWIDAFVLRVYGDEVRQWSV